MDANSSINANSYNTPYSDMEKRYKTSSLATILAASCCLKLSNEVKRHAASLLPTDVL